MAPTSASAFLLRHRFEPRDVIPSGRLGFSHEDWIFAQNFPKERIIRWQFGSRQSLDELNRAFAVAEYMSSYSTDQPEGYARLVSSLSEDGWQFALSQCEFHHICTALKNLDLIYSAMLEAQLGLSSAKAGMEVAIGFPESEAHRYDAERSKAAIHLLNFASLYASYVDTCRRIRKRLNLDKKKNYDSAIKRVIGKTAGELDFLNGLRNYILHYSIASPYVVIDLTNRRSKLLLDSHTLLFGGFQWRAAAPSYIQSKPNIDVNEMADVVVSAVARLIKFHKNTCKASTI